MAVSLIGLLGNRAVNLIDLEHSTHYFIIPDKTRKVHSTPSKSTKYRFPGAYFKRWHHSSHPFSASAYHRPEKKLNEKTSCGFGEFVKLTYY